MESAYLGPALPTLVTCTTSFWCPGFQWKNGSNFKSVSWGDADFSPVSLAENTALPVQPRAARIQKPQFPNLKHEVLATYSWCPQ